jgi:ABC-type sugar transport system substrate-binding protein
VLGICLIWGCDKLPTADDAGAKAVRLKRRPEVIAFVGAARRDPLWPVLRASGEQYGRDLCSMEVRFLCPSGDSPQDQIDLLRSLDGPTLQGLCIQINNIAAVEPTLRRLHKRGMRIVSMVQPAPQDIRVAHVGFDEAAIGRALAQATARAIRDRGTIMLLHAGLEHPVYGPRLIGFEQEFSARHRIKVLASIDCRMDPLQARSIIRERSKRFPRLSAWVSLADWPLQGLGLADDPLPAGCRFITFGGSPPHWPLIRNGTSPAIVAANYREMGAKAIQYCEVAIRNPTHFEERYAAPLRTIWSTNLDAYIKDWSSWIQRATGTETGPPTGIREPGVSFSRPGQLQAG